MGHEDNCLEPQDVENDEIVIVRSRTAETASAFLLIKIRVTTVKIDVGKRHAARQIILSVCEINR